MTRRRITTRDELIRVIAGALRSHRLGLILDRAPETSPRDRHLLELDAAMEPTPMELSAADAVAAALINRGVV